MAITEQIARSGPYLERLLDDDYLHENLAVAARRGREVYGRVSGRPARKAATDKRVHRALGDGAESLRNALLALQGPRPKRRRRGVRVLAVLALVGAAGAAVAAQRSTSATQEA
jgi:hypothetical protein